MELIAEVAETKAILAELAEPSIPLDFLEFVFLQEGSECLFQWVHKNAPKPVKDLYDAIDQAAILVKEAREHSGKVIAGPLAWDGPSFREDILKGIRAMSTLGHKWA